MVDSLEQLIKLRDRALKDEVVDGNRADKAYFSKDVKQGRFYAQEARRDFLQVGIYQSRIDRLTRTDGIATRGE